MLSYFINNSTFTKAEVKVLFYLLGHWLSNITVEFISNQQLVCCMVAA